MSAGVLSVVIPVRDGGASFDRCLAALVLHRDPALELFVVDDGSRDGSAARAAAAGARVLSAGGAGPAAARNLGARAASGDWILFLDSDCEVHPETLERARQAIRAHPDAGALFGSYDDTPAAPGWLSQYRNLLHCHTHRTARREASTFWSGCGLVRREAFLAVGGFDADRFPRPGMEDIDLGYRLREAGHRLRVEPAIEVKHLKAWSLGRVIRADLLERGIPWTRLWLERRGAPADLNLGWRHRITAAAATALAVAAPAAAIAAARGATAATALGLAGLATLALLVANLPFLGFLARRRGFAFTVAALGFHAIYGGCCALSFVVGSLLHLRDRFRPGSPAPLRSPRSARGGEPNGTEAS